MDDVKGKILFLNGWKYYVSYVGDKYCILSNGITLPIRIKKNKVRKYLGLEKAKGETE